MLSANTGRRDAGGLLVELLVLVALLALIGHQASGRYQQSQAYLSGKQAANSITSLLILARSQALAAGRSVSVCFLSGDTCAKHSDDSKLTVFIDGDQRGRLDAEDSLLAKYQPASDLFRLVALQRYLSFNPNGSVNRPTSYYLCHHRQSEWGQRLVISKPGRVRVAADDADLASRLRSYC